MLHPLPQISSVSNREAAVKTGRKDCGLWPFDGKRPLLTGRPWLHQNTRDAIDK